MITGFMTGTGFRKQRIREQPNPRKPGFVVIIDVANTRALLRDRMAVVLSHSGKAIDIDEMVQSTLASILEALVQFVKSHRNEDGAYNEFLMQAIDNVAYFGIHPEIAAGLVHQTETELMIILGEYFSNMEDTEAHTIVKHFFMKDGSFCLQVAITV